MNQDQVSQPVPDNPGLITIRRDYYAELEANAAKLAALEAGGVDNWEGYAFAMEEAGFAELDEILEEANTPQEDVGADSPPATSQEPVSGDATEDDQGVIQ